HLANAAEQVPAQTPGGGDCRARLAVRGVARHLELQAERTELVSDLVVEVAGDSLALGVAEALGGEGLWGEELRVDAKQVLTGPELTYCQHARPEGEAFQPGKLGEGDEVRPARRVASEDGGDEEQGHGLEHHQPDGERGRERERCLAGEDDEGREGE